jgi:hypothetical protein
MISIPTTGRRPRFCSGRCRVAAKRARERESGQQNLMGHGGRENAGPCEPRQEERLTTGIAERPQAGSSPTSPTDEQQALLDELVTATEPKLAGQFIYAKGGIKLCPDCRERIEVCRCIHDNCGKGRRECQCD